NVKLLHRTVPAAAIPDRRRIRFQSIIAYIRDSASGLLLEGRRAATAAVPARTFQSVTVSALAGCGPSRVETRRNSTELMFRFIVFSFKRWGLVVQNRSFICIHMLRVPLLVKSRFRNWEGEPACETGEPATLLFGI